MKKVLSIKDRRYLLILEILFNKEHLTLSHIAKIIKTSKRNLQNDIASINGFIEPMTITTSLKVGCSLVCPENYSIDYIYRCILKNSLEFSLLELVFFEKYTRLDDYADALFVSLSTIKRSIITINAAVAPLDFKISTGPIELLGNEKNICRFMMFYFREAYQPNQLPFSKIQIDSLNKMIRHGLSKEKNYLNYPDIYMLRLVSLISVIRIQNGHFIPDKTSIPDSVDLDTFLDFFPRSVFKSIFKIDITTEVLYRLLYPVFNDRFIQSYDRLIELSEENASIKQNILNIDSFLESISTELCISITNKEKLILELFNAIHLIMGENCVLYNQKKCFLDNFIHNVPYLSDYFYKLFQKASTLNRLFEPYELEELAYILITHWEDFAKKIASLKPNYSVGLFMNCDVEHSEFIASTLSLHFSNEMTFTPMTAMTVKEAMKEANNFEFVITNISGLTKTAIKFVCIGLYPTPDDFQKIANAYEIVANP